MNKLFKSSTFLSFIVLAIAGLMSFSIIANMAQALTEADIVYPVAELGNCPDKTACKVFCNNPDNLQACVDFAERYTLLSQDEIKKARAVINVGSGPGGCQGKDACEQFCEDTANIETCLDFAQKNDLMSSEEIEEGKKLAKALKEGASLPGGCRNKTACEAYCEDPSHMEECLNFAERAGFIPPGELEEAKKVAKAMSSGIRPPGNCRGKTQCEEYCSNPDNMETCMDFAVKAGLMPPEELEQAKKMIPLMKQGQMPGGCRGKSECESYCQDESHTQECMEFAVKAGFMKPEEAEQFRKTGGKGPGGCKGKNECEAFCNDPANQETCFGFAKEHGLIPEDQLQNLEEGTRMLKEQLGNTPPEVAECLRSNGISIEKIQSGQIPGPQMGELMRSCFEQFGGMGPGMGHESQDGPGFGPQGSGPQGRPENMPHEGMSPEDFERMKQTQEQMRGESGQYGHPEGGPPPGFEGQTPPPGDYQIPSPEQRQQFEQQYREEYQQQIEQQYQQQQQQPPPDYQQYQQPPPDYQQHQSPDQNQYAPPPPPGDYSAPPPTSLYLDNNFLGLITKFILGGR